VGNGRAVARVAGAGLDLRMRLAGILAGVARKAASGELDGRGDAGLTALLRPCLGADSVWGDAPSWVRMRGDPANTRPTPVQMWLIGVPRGEPPAPDQRLS
jgi:hypothetical protein